MVHFLRNKGNETIIECSVYKNDLSSAVELVSYSNMLIELHNKDLHYPFLKDMSELDDIRGWWWEMAKDSGDYKSIDDFVKEKYMTVAKKHNLNYITD